MASRAETATDKLEIILGADAVARLAASTVLVVGIGGVGSNCVEALARGGVGGLVVVDADVVAPSNINRQAIAYQSTLGLRKVDACERLVLDINPACRVVKRHEFVDAERAPALYEECLAAAGGRIDYVVDAIDSLPAKLALAELAQERGFALVSSMGAANKLHPECLRFADVYETVNCPLSRAMRKGCRKRGIRQLHVLYSCEVPVRTQAPAGAERTARTVLGTASWMPPIMGQMIAGEVICRLTGAGAGDDVAAALAMGAAARKTGGNDRRGERP